ncbi:hypothetical protein BH11BAC2_BH11BAC2_22880 [soil metagenome]
MTDQIGGIISYLIGVLVMVYILFMLKGKQKEDPGMIVLGQPIQRIIILVTIGIVFDAILILAIFMGWIKY